VSGQTVSGRTALIANGGGRLAVPVARALSATCERILVAFPGDGAAQVRGGLAAIPGAEFIAADCRGEAGWSVLAARPEAAAGAIDVMVQCPPELADLPADLAAEHVLRAAWLGAKHANAFMRGRDGVLLTLCRAAAPGEVDVERASAAGGLRIALAGALLDAMQAGLRLRSNRLLLADGTDERDVIAAAAMLTDGRGSFITGEELALAPRAGTGTAGFSGRLDGKAVLVTGATSPIGRATAIEIGRLGGWVGVGARKPELAAETLAMVRAAGGDGMVLSLDIRRADEWARAVGTIRECRGGVHGLVNNAGDARYGAIAEMSVGDLDHVLGINYRACLTGMEQLAGPIAASGGGAIVNVASVAGLRAGYANSVYGGSRGAMIAMTRAFPQRPGHPAGVRVNSVQAGLIWSDNVVETLGRQGADDFRAMIEPKTPLGRVGQPGEIGRPIAFLLSDAAAPIDGQAIAVSGGLELCYP
jgi:NAD(P)-dependent dehydrogenase (short-subunit alcohol dehydrogenase family)